MSLTHSPAPVEIKQRVARLLGGYGSGSRFARGLGLSVEHVGRVLNGSAAPPEAWIAILELLEALPEDRWPDRWRR